MGSGQRPSAHRFLPLVLRLNRSRWSGSAFHPQQPRHQPTAPAQVANAQPKVSGAKVAASRWSAPPMRGRPHWGSGRTPRTHREQAGTAAVSTVPRPGRGLKRLKVQQRQQRPLAECGALRAVLIGEAPKPPYCPPLRSRLPRLPQPEDGCCILIRCPSGRLIGGLSPSPKPPGQGI